MGQYKESIGILNGLRFPKPLKYLQCTLGTYFCVSDQWGGHCNGLAILWLSLSLVWNVTNCIRTKCSNKCRPCGWATPTQLYTVFWIVFERVGEQINEENTYVYPIAI